MGEFFHHYTEILTDPAHLAVEITLMLLVDVVFLGLIWPFFRTYFERKLAHQHAVLDREHGVRHHRDHVHREPAVESDDECVDVPDPDRAPS